jgi:uncharacterized protein involved in exopolysaccharide biosynthesis
MAKRARPAPPESYPLDPEFPDQAPRASLRDWVEYALGAVRRLPWRTAAVFVVGLALTTGFYYLKTPLYRAETKILTQRQQAMPSISRGAMSDEAPTRTANELIRRRENLLALLDRAGALPTSGAPAKANARKRLLDLGSSPATTEEAVNAMVQALDRSLTVTTGDGTVTISVDWPDAQQAYSLVQEALQNFLEARQVQEITAVDEALTLLHGRTAELRTQLELAIRETQRDLSGARDLAAEAEPSRTPPLPARASEELAKRRAAAEAVSRSIRDLEDLRSRRLADLQAQLTERRTVFSDAHPTVIALKREIEGLSQESPQLAALRDEEARLQEEYRARLAAEDPRAASANASRAYVAARRSAPIPAATVNESEAVRDARFRYSQMVDRLNAAQLDLDSARAAFKHRYSVLWPAQVPTRPVSPNPWKVFGVGTVLSLLLALAAVTVPDLRAGRIMERSQVERTLGIPVLALISRK